MEVALTMPTEPLQAPLAMPPVQEGQSTGAAQTLPVGPAEEPLALPSAEGRQLAGAGQALLALPPAQGKMWMQWKPGSRPKSSCSSS